MKTNNLICTIAIFAVVLLLGCSSKEGSINSLRDFTEKLEAECENYNADDWDEALDEYLDISENLQKHDYNRAQEREIGKLEGRCVALFTKAVVDGYLNSAVGFLDGFMEGIDGFKDNIDDYGEQIEKIFDRK